jgi:alpha-tubulin suppressor-like RCC1 family protein
VSQQYPGGFITKSPPATVGPVDGEGGSAPGVWTLDQAMTLNKQGLWPKPVLPRQLWSWGDNGSGQLGLGTLTNYSSPKQVGSLGDWSKISCGTDHTIAIKANGTLWSWGTGGEGRLGLGNTTSYSSPKQVGALTTWAYVGAGQGHSLAIKTDGTLWSWGQNNFGQLGLGNTVNRSSPVQVGALTNWAKVAAANSVSVAIKTDGTLWTWGYNFVGTLGLGDSGEYTDRSSPTQVGALTTWKNIAPSELFVIATKTDGTLWAWGQNQFGQLGTGNTTYRSSPVQVGALTNWSIVGGGNHTSRAIKTDGTFWAWGNNVYGQIGDGTTVYRSSPVQVGVLTTWSILAYSTTSPSTMAIKTDGTLWAWGYNASGRLGLGNTTNRSSPVQVGALTTWRAVTQGGAFTVAIKTS